MSVKTSRKWRNSLTDVMWYVT